MTENGDSNPSASCPDLAFSQTIFSHSELSINGREWTSRSVALTRLSYAAQTDEQGFKRVTNQLAFNGFGKL